MNGVALCCGIGGIELGLHLALGDAYRTVAWCDSDPHCRAVIAQRIADGIFQPAPILERLEDIDGAEWAGRVDIVTAGFPCQPWSSAGRHGKTADARWIWPAIAQLVRAIRPRIVFLENVPGLIAGGGLASVLGDLAAGGFDAEWSCLRASDLGAPHKRRRVFILAHRDGRGLQGIRRPGLRDGYRPPHGNDLDGCHEELVHAEGWGIGQESNIAEQPPEEHARHGRGGVFVGNADVAGLAEREDEREDEREELTPTERAGRPLVDDPMRLGPRAELQVQAGGHAAFPPGPGDREAWGLIDHDFLPAIEQAWEPARKAGPEAQPALRGMAHGASSRVVRLHACGNGCVPIVAAYAFLSLARRACQN